MSRLDKWDIRPCNVISVDVEDWFHICGVSGAVGHSPESRVGRNVERLLEKLDSYAVKATFFVLGSVAEAIPGLVREIAARGHEIASHGYSHSLVHGLGAAGFRDEIRRTGEILEMQSGQRPMGFRAPQWSLSGSVTPWAFEVLAEEGYRYDSSCNPLRFVGDPDGPTAPFRVALKSGDLWEIPPMVTPSPLGNLPTGGGWGLRLFPMSLIERTIRHRNERGEPAVLYLHPRELDPDGPRLRLNPLREFAAYGPRTDVVDRLDSLLQHYSFSTLFSLVKQWDSV